MTLIECFTDSHLDNIAACLYFRPDKLIMLGDLRQMEAPLERYRTVLRNRGIPTRITQQDIRDTDLRTLCGVLTRLVQSDGDCVFDLTGGGELVTMAVGAVYAGLNGEKRQRVRVEKYHHDIGKAVECINGCRILPGTPVQLTVKELIFLHGGRMLPDTWQPPADFTAKALEGLWSVVSDAPREWNKSVSLLREFESRSDSKTDISLPLGKLKGSISNFDEKEETVRNLLDSLARQGVIRDQSSRNQLRYRYESEALRFCTQKAGNVLEVKTLLEARGIRENGQPYFHDCRMGVSIDWDGVFHLPAAHIPETRNEVDAVVTRGTTPLFISCKNGYIGEDELYKLHTVASRFAGSRCRKMLIATDLNQKNDSSNRAFIQRAWDMDIFLVPDAASLSPEEWRQTLIQAIQ